MRHVALRLIPIGLLVVYCSSCNQPNTQPTNAALLTEINRLRGELTGAANVIFNAAGEFYERNNRSNQVTIVTLHQAVTNSNILEYTNKDTLYFLCQRLLEMSPAGVDS